MDYHSFAREVRINYGTCAQLPTSIDALFQNLAITVAAEMTFDRVTYRQARSCCMGGQIHSAYNQLGSLAFLTETGNSFQPQPPAMREEVARVWRGTLSFLQLKVPLTGRVLSADGGPGAGLRALVSFPQIRFLQNERFVSARNGLYHAWLPTGTWQVAFSAEGYNNLTVSITIEQGRSRNQDVVLTRQ
jgi:hypothetical protein